MTKDENDESPSKRAMDSAEESLNEALSDLEHMLQSQRDETDEREPAPSPGEANTGRGEQERPIPLLDEVVIPGSEQTLTGTDSQAEQLAESDIVYARIIERLASEIEVIVQAEVEDALEHARERIRQQVSDHIEIMLPEILGELGGLERPDPHE